MVNFTVPNNRKQPRVLTNMDVVINDSMRGLAFDVSEKGMYIHTTENKFARNSTIEVTFNVRCNAITTKAVVEHLQQGFGIGVRFINMPPHMSSALREFISSSESKLAEMDRKTVLLVVSDTRSRSFYKMSLMQGGFAVLEAASGQETLECLQQKRPDIVVMDLNVGGLSAVKILQLMRGRKNLQDVPAIVLSSNFLTEDVAQIIALGASNCLNKATTNPIVLCKKVKDILTS